MKRSIAILGHTPQFVRWAIRKACPLRELSENLPDDAFRQLRGLRALSMGRAEERVINGICIHPSASSKNVGQARGFFASEVLEAHGDEGQVDKCCGGCPANALESSVPNAWAGCYGWLPANNEFQFDVTNEAKANSPTVSESSSLELSFVETVDQSIADLGLAHQAGRLFQATTPRWYGIWQTRSMSVEQVIFLTAVFDNLVDQVLTPSLDLVHFQSALRLCEEHQLTLNCELIPAGFSDGQTWTIERCCPDCSFSIPESGDKLCPACGRFGSPLEVRKSKVLGLRPYVHLNGIIGKANTAKLLANLKVD